MDLEVSKSTGRLHRIGAVFRDKTFQWTGGRQARQALAELEIFGRKAGYLLGHNLFNHDLPFIKGLAPDLKLLERPVIDTLYLSPLAFPRNPYHRLVKNYKLVRASQSDPIADAHLAIAVFREQWDAFSGQLSQAPELPAFYRFCFQQSRFGGFSGRGLAQVLKTLGAAPLEESHLATAIFKRQAHGRACMTAVEGALADDDAPAVMENAAVAAYALAWLRVAGANSVLPPWVRHQFPAVVPFLKKLRDLPCGHSDCTYCRQTHDPDTQLKRFFGFDRYRPVPAAENGEGLQRTLVLNGLKDIPLLAIMPTGGGKSLCFQLPALIRHQRRGLLTVVISPLQALMKDQVDNLVRNTGTPFAGAIYGLLIPPERGEVLERVRLGDIAILYLSPEQLRSKSVCSVLAQREIGCWVFDEAHCLSKWGHDFRPDYMYAARFIKEFSEKQRLPLPPVACYTATAKPDVIEEIAGYFQTELKQNLHIFAGGVERDNLSFEVLQVSGVHKSEQTFELVTRYLSSHPSAGVIVYAARRRTTEEIQKYLSHKGVMAEAFHGGLESNEKRRIIEAFVNGETPVICATNAFGMGIDKENIRLVLHYDIPGSLENYLQEAGRAGRDLQPAHCILLYDPEDAETQFKLGAGSEIGQDEIQRILKCLKNAKRNRNNEIVITSQELIRDETLAALFEKGDRSSDTKVRTAVSWLERAGFLQRDQNMTQVFQGKLLVRTMEAAEELIQKADLSPFVQKLWRNILRTMFNAPPDQGLGADDIAETMFGSVETLKRLEKQFGLTPAQLVIHTMHDMAAAGILDKGMVLSAFVRTRGLKNALKQFDGLCVLEERLLKFLQEEDPDAETGSWVDLDLSRVNQRLRNDGQQSNPVTVRNLVKGLTYDGEGLAGSHGSIELQHVSRNRYRVALRRSWPALIETAALRRSVAQLIVRELVSKAKKALPPSGQGASGELLVSFSANELTEAISQDLFLHSNVQKPLAAVDRGLMFLHENKIITLQNGLAVFRQAMTIRLNAGAGRRRYSRGDYQPLKIHYGERRFQVHVMMEYARLAMDKIAQALGLILDYFAMPRHGFAKKYFAGREQLLQRATSAESYRQIVESLDHPVQIDIVGRPVQANQLVLAGPGAGKTRVVVHRCAYLLRVERIAAGRILVMCFNHNAAVALRKRLHQMAGRDARGVTVATYHGAAMRLAGISLRALLEHQGAQAIDFSVLVREATALLKGEKEAPGVDPDEMRDQLLQGFSHILVDEYQDIDQDQYDLVSAIAGRTRQEGDGRLALMAVGDDDQNVYAFRGANVGFIQRFRQDYGAEAVYMVENFRSSAHIIAAANQLIARNHDRMKHDHPIRVDRRRQSDPPGGLWETLDPLSRGRVQRLTVADPVQQAGALWLELSRLKSLKPSLEWPACAVLARTGQTLAPVRAVFEANGIPIQRGLKRGLPLHRIREVHQFLTALRAVETDIRKASRIGDLLAQECSRSDGRLWIELLRDLHTAYRQETDDAALPVRYYLDWLYEALAEQRREKTLGRGVFLNTVHSAKGLAFDHVFILDSDWRMPAERQKQEEERRLYYVGMTRAKETLCLLELQRQGNPFIRPLAGDHILRRPGPAGDPDASRSSPARQYHILGLNDLYLGYAGTFAREHPIHSHLAQTGTGDRLFFVENGDAVEVHDPTGLCIAKLSNAGRLTWAPKLSQILEVRVLGMIRRTIDESGEQYRHLAMIPSWELPLMEVVFQEDTPMGL